MLWCGHLMDFLPVSTWAEWFVPICSPSSANGVVFPVVCDVLLGAGISEELSVSEFSSLNMAFQEIWIFHDSGL